MKQKIVQISVCLLAALSLTAGCGKNNLSDPSSASSSSVEAPSETTPVVSEEDTGITDIEKAEYIKAHPELYPDELQSLLQNYPETIDYVYNYPQKKEFSYTIDLTDEINSDVPMLLQWDERWGYESYAGGMIGYTGCGPTSMSMVALYLTKNATYTPLYIAQLCEKNGYCTEGGGTTWDLMEQGSSELGLSVKELAVVEKHMKQALDRSHPLILNLGPGDFTTDGHYLVVSGYTEEGFVLHDPNSLENSKKVWSFDRLESQIKNIWEFSMK